MGLWGRRCRRRRRGNCQRCRGAQPSRNAARADTREDFQSEWMRFVESVLLGAKRRAASYKREPLKICIDQLLGYNERAR